MNLPDQELHTTAVWWQLPQPILESAFADRQQALDGFLAAAHALHLVATVAVMAEARDLQKAVGSGDGAWFASSDGGGRGRLRGIDGRPAAAGALEQFTPTLYLYDNYPGGIGQSEPLFLRHGDLVHKARELVAACDCRAGCPACVGPVLGAEEALDASAPKALGMRALDLLGAA